MLDLWTVWKKHPNWEKISLYTILKIGKMYDILVAKYPFSFDIPSETEIKTFINLMFQNAKYAEKKNKRNNDSDNRQSTKESRGRKKGTIETQEWVGILDTVVEADKKGKPSELYNKLMEVLGSDPKAWPIDLPLKDENTPHVEKIKEKISYLKGKWKAIASKNILI